MAMWLFGSGTFRGVRPLHGRHYVLGRSLFFSELQCLQLENKEEDDLSGKIRSSCHSRFISGFLWLRALSQAALQSIPTHFHISSCSVVWPGRASVGHLTLTIVPACLEAGMGGCILKAERSQKPLGAWGVLRVFSLY